jgi:SAM-dependent methyltransferase
VILPRTYFPKHEENRFEREGQVELAREMFLKHRPRNLEFLLKKRYAWMNDWIKPGDRVVEFGAGSGFSKLYIAHDDFTMTDVEARPYLDGVADALDPPHADGSIDVAIFSHMIHHLANPTKFFAVFRRKLAPGGRILIQDLNTCFLLRLALRAMRHEGWSLDANVFDPDVVANDPRDPWSANCAIPQLLFEKPGEFEAHVPGFTIERNEVNECFSWLVTGGVVVQASTLQLPHWMLRFIDRMDDVLIRMMPGVFAMGRSVVLRKQDAS